MALSGSVTTSSCEGRSVTLNWSASQNVANNTSTISWSIVGSGSTTSWVRVSELRATINGSQVYYRDSSNHTDCYQGTVLASGTTTISHNADGSKSFSISLEAGIYNWTINCSGSGTFTLNTIARASKPTLSKSSASLGDTITINTNRASSSFTHKISYSFGNASGTIATNVGASTTWTIPLSLANQIPSATSGYGSITCETYNGSTKIGSNYVRFDVSVPASVVPTVSSASVAVDNSANSVIKGWGLWVAGYSKARITAAASGAYGSTISGFNISGGASASVTGSSLDYTTGTINTSGDITFDVTATDSRGRTSAAKSTSAVTVYPYSAPQITEFSTHRNSSTPTNVIAKANWDIASVNSKNAATATLYYKKASATSWTTYGTISKNTSIALTATFEEESSYNFRLIVTDSVGNSAQEENRLSTGTALMDYRTGGGGISFGKMSESDSFEVDLPAKFYKNIEVANDSGTLVALKNYLRDLLYPIGSIKMTTVNTNPSTYLGGTWVAWGSGKVPVGVNTSETEFDTVEKTGGAKTHTLSEAQMPSHTHSITIAGTKLDTTTKGTMRAYAYTKGTGGEFWDISFGKAPNGSTKYSPGSTHDLVIVSSGSGDAHNNLQPYVTCYMWKRTA